jgi:hypothetical protein
MFACESEQAKWVRWTGKSAVATGSASGIFSNIVPIGRCPFIEADPKRSAHGENDEAESTRCFLRSLI